MSVRPILGSQFRACQVSLRPCACKTRRTDGRRPWCLAFECAEREADRNAHNFDVQRFIARGAVAGEASLSSSPSPASRTHRREMVSSIRIRSYGRCEPFRACEGWARYNVVRLVITYSHLAVSLPMTTSSGLDPMSSRLLKLAEARARGTQGPVRISHTS